VSIYREAFDTVFQVCEYDFQVLGVLFTAVEVYWRYGEIDHLGTQRVHHIVVVYYDFSLQSFRCM